MKKKFTLCLLVISTILSLFNLNVTANDEITVYVNEQMLQCEELPFTDNGRTMVPMRKIFEALSADVDWDDTTQTITATKDDLQIILQIDNPVMYNNGLAETLDVAPMIVNDLTFVPVRAVSQSFNAMVEWFENAQTVYINSPITYNNEYNSYVDYFMQGTVFAGYKLTKNFANEVKIDDNACLQGFVEDVRLQDNNVCLIVKNRYAEADNAMVCIGSKELTDLEKMVEIFKGKNISVGGRCITAADTVNLPVLALDFVNVFENDRVYNSSELTYPKLSQIDDVVVLYDLYGQAQYVPATQTSEYLEVGWYLEPVVTMYAPDGRTIDVPTSEVESYKNVGWYLEPVVTMYAPDGRTIGVPTSEVESYKNVGWYQTYNEAQETNTASYSAYSYSETDYYNRPNSKGERVYRTPRGKRYHFDPDCGGRNSYETTLQKAENAGLTPCKKCAR